MALLAKGWKAAAAVVIVGLLSGIVMGGNLLIENRRCFATIFAVGAVVGLLVSIAVTVLMMRKAPGLRAKNLILTVGAVAGGAVVLSIQAVSEPLVGEKAADTGMIILNYMLGYFMVGVTMDAVRVYRRARRAKEKK